MRLFSTDFSKEDVFVYFLLCPSFFLYVLFNRFPLIYVVPFVYVIYSLYTDLKVQQLRKFEFGDFSGLLVAILGLGIVSLVVQDINFDQKVWIRDMVILSGSILPFVLSNSFDEKHVKAMFLVQSVSYFLWIDYYNFFSFTSYHQLGRVASEYDMGLFFGLFTIYFLSRKSYTWFFSALLVSYLIHKRVIFVGFLFASLVYSFNFVVEKLNWRRRDLLMAFMLFLVLGFISLYLVDLITFYLKQAGKKPSLTDRFLNGRSGVLSFSSFKIMHSGFFQLWFGHGPGQLDSIVTLFRPVRWAQYSTTPTNPHNDFLKILYDYGITGFVVIGYFFSRIYTHVKYGIYLFVFTIVLFLVDNSFIHIYYNLIAYVMLRSKNYEG